MTAKYSIETINEIDINVIIEIQTECCLNRWSYQDYRDEILRRDSVLYAAKNKRTVLGFIVARLINANLSNNKNFIEAEIYNLAVRPNFQQKGVGTLLLQRFIQKAKENGVNFIWLEVRESNRTALDFYKNNKFKKIYKKKNFYTLPSDNADIMKLDVFQSALETDEN